MSWVDEAHEAMRTLIARGDPFTADDLLALVGPPDLTHAPNATNSTIGGIFGQYSSGGQITAVDVRQSTAPRRKGGLIRVWAPVEPEPALFSMPGATRTRHRRRKSTKPREIKLVPPWVLLGGHREARAHLLVPKGAPNEKGAWPARCGRLGYRINVEGQPMALVCTACWDLAQ